MLRGCVPEGRFEHWMELRQEQHFAVFSSLSSSSRLSDDGTAGRCVSVFGISLVVRRLLELYAHAKAKADSKNC